MCGVGLGPGDEVFHVLHAGGHHGANGKAMVDHGGGAHGSEFFKRLVLQVFEDVGVERDGREWCHGQNRTVGRSTLEQIQRNVKEHVINPVVPKELIDEDTKYFINPTGRFVIGGPQGDAGLTGRKIIVDTYGGYARHGGGAFSGKDPTKVDRSAAYAARYVAKNIVAAGLADKCEVQLAYAIGVAQPVSIAIDTFETGKVKEDVLVDVVRENFDLRPAGIINMLNLRRPIYKQTAAYGHFGRNDLDLPWERTDKAEVLKEQALNR